MVTCRGTEAWNFDTFVVISLEALGVRSLPSTLCSHVWEVRRSGSSSISNHGIALVPPWPVVGVEVGGADLGGGGGGAEWLGRPLAKCSLNGCLP